VLFCPRAETKLILITARAEADSLSKASKERMKLTVEIVRRGGILLKEPCPVCGGVQVRYRGKVYCTNHEDLSGVLSTEEVTYEGVASALRTLLLSKTREAADLLEKERDTLKQDQLVSLLSKYVELLQKLPEHR
jgi:UPF0148 protein